MVGLTKKNTPGILCPECGGQSRIYDTRTSRSSHIGTILEGSIDRRRTCVKCKHSFHTYELTPEMMDYLIGDSEK